MKINRINNAVYSLLVAGTIICNVPTKAQKIDNLSGDTFEYTIPKTGSDNLILLSDAPSPEVKIAGKKYSAIFVVDTKRNLLYKYNEGQATNVYPVATGKPSTPTKTGIRKVTHVEKYPYSNAPQNCKRRKTPSVYGPRIIFLDKVDKDTGEISSNDEFIHGTNNPNSIGNYASMGCIRMNNEVIKQLATEVECGDIVLIL